MMLLLLLLSQLQQVEPVPLLPLLPPRRLLPREGDWLGPLALVHHTVVVGDLELASPPPTALNTVFPRRRAVRRHPHVS